MACTTLHMRRKAATLKVGQITQHAHLRSSKPVMMGSDPAEHTVAVMTHIMRYICIYVCQPLQMAHEATLWVMPVAGYQRRPLNPHTWPVPTRHHLKLSYAWALTLGESIHLTTFSCQPANS